MNNDLIGIIGAGLVLVGFIFNQLNILKNSSIFYDFINFLGSLFLLIYAFILESTPFIVVNLVWALFSLKDVLWFFLKNSRTEDLLENKSKETKLDEVLKENETNQDSNNL